MLLITNIIQYFMPEKGKYDVKINDAVLVKSKKHILIFLIQAVQFDSCALIFVDKRFSEFRKFDQNWLNFAPM